MMGPEHLGPLIDAHAAALTLYARQWCGTSEDVVQEAFVKLATRTVPPNVVPWLYAVVRNGAISAARSERRRQHHEAQAAARAPAWFAPPDGEGLDAALVANALGALPLEEREVVVAHVWGGLTFEQIGMLIGASAATAYRRYAAGLAGLRGQVGSPMSEPTLDPELAALSAALGALAPAQPVLDRDRLFFEAGRRAARPRGWPLTAFGFAVLSATLSLHLAIAPVPTERLVVATAPASRERERPEVVQPPVAHAPGSPDPIEPRSTDAAYLRLRNEVLRFGPDALPPLPTVVAEPPAPPIRVRGLLDSGLPSQWFFPIS